MRTQTLLMAIALLFAATAASHDTEFRPGTHDIRICSADCPFDDNQNVLVAGSVVLDSAYWSLEHFASYAAAGFTLAYIGTRPNGCYVLERLRNDGKVYAGLAPTGLTLWRQSTKDSLVRFPLFQSPDASYNVEVSVTSHGFAGRGRSSGVGAAAPGMVPAQRVIGRFVGPPDVQRCLAARPMEDARPRRPAAPIYVNDYISRL